MGPSLAPVSLPSQTPAFRQRLVPYFLPRRLFASKACPLTSFRSKAFGPYDFLLSFFLPSPNPARLITLFLARSAPLLRSRPLHICLTFQPQYPPKRRLPFSGERLYTLFFRIPCVSFCRVYSPPPFSFDPPDAVCLRLRLPCSSLSIRE